MPYVGYFSLIANSDIFLLLDTAPYIRHGWINRNRILKPDRNNWQYIVVPLEKYSRGQSIEAININYNTDWANKILRQLNHYSRIAQNHTEITNLLDNVFQERHKTVLSLNKSLIEKMCIELGITTPILLYSDIIDNKISIRKGQNWALDACKKIHPAVYLNPLSGSKIFNSFDFNSAGTKIKYLDQRINIYDQVNSKFIERLSIVDMLMFNSKEYVREQLTNIIID